MKTTDLFKPFLSLVSILACLACGQSHVNAASGMAAEGWSLNALKNATYSGLKLHAAPVTLIEGRWEGQPYVDGGESRPSVHFVGDLYRIGKVAGTEVDAAVVFLSESSGGSGSFLNLAVVEKKNGSLINTNTVPVGDRVQILDVRIEHGMIAVDVLQAGPQDAACCPGELSTRHWDLNANQLMESVAPVRTRRLSLDSIAGATWKLHAWEFDKPAPDEPEITLVYDNGRVAGSAGCNRYFASVTAGSRPGDLQVGPSGSTRMMCSEAIMAIEQRFLKQLNGVGRFGFLAGQLSLSFQMDGKHGTMRFDKMDSLP